MKRIILAVITAALVVGFGLYFYRDMQIQRAEKERQTLLLNEARSYEKEIASIREELEAQEKESNSIVERPSIIPAFLPTSITDMKKVQRFYRAYDFIPVIILDCSLPEDEVHGILKLLKGEFEVMITCRDINEESLELAKKVEKLLPRFGFDEKPVFYLQEETDNEENLAAVLDAGFTSLSRISQNNVVTVVNEDVPVLPYIVGEDIIELGEKLTYFCDYRSYLLYVTDLNMLYETEILEADMSDMLSYIHRIVAQKLMTYCTVQEAVEDIPEAVERLAAQRKAYDAFALGQSWKIASLEKQIQEVYSQW